MNEAYLREKIATQSASADNYVELAGLLFEACRFEESIAILTQALNMPFDNVSRAVLLTALGRQVYGASGNREEPRALGEQALRLIEGFDTPEAALARAEAQLLVAEFVSLDDPTRARALAGSALPVFDRTLAQDRIPGSLTRYELFLAAASLNILLGRFESASARCKQALAVASNRYEKMLCLIELGTSYRMAGQLNEARNVFTEAIGYQDASPFGLVRPYYELGLTESELGKHAEARAKVRKAIEIVQSDPGPSREPLAELLRVEGYISYDLEDTDDAARSFQSAVDEYPVTDPFHWNSLLWLARCQYVLGQLEDARKNATLVKGSPVASEGDLATADELLAAMGAGTM